MIQSPAGYQGDVRIKRYLDFYQAGYGVAMLSSGAAFTPAELFAAGEQGGWYDPSDLTTLYQDAAGTTPVTAVEQPVGLVLDKSRGLVLGNELVTNGDFSNGTTGWLSGSFAGYGGTLTNVGGAGLLTVSSSYYWVWQTFTSVIGRTYKVTGTVSNTAGGGSVYAIRKADNSDLLSAVNLVTLRLGAGTFDGVFTATATTTFILLQVNGTGASATFDNISVRELPGNHLSQSTAAARPVLSARVNLLTRTEEFDNAAWTKSNVVISANAITAPDGALTGDKLYPLTTGSNRFVYQPLTLASGLYRFSVRAKAGEKSILYIDLTGAGTTQAFFDLSTGTVGSVSAGYSATITSLGNGWFECSATNNSPSSYSFGGVYGVADANGSTSVTASGTSGIYIWGADLRPANAGAGLPAYQRVGAATAGSSTAAGNADYDTTGFPLYLKFDGTDDSLSSASIDFTSTDKMSVFAGVRKLSDGSTGVVYELSAAAGGNNGSFHLYNSGGSANYTISSQGTSTASASYTNAAIAAPITNVATSVLGISTDQCVLRLNGSQVAQSTTDQGTGNFGNYPLYVGRRGGTSLPFNGQLYSLIVRGAATDAATITATETWVNQRTKAF